MTMQFQWHPNDEFSPPNSRDSRRGWIQVWELNGESQLVPDLQLVDSLINRGNAPDER